MSHERFAQPIAIPAQQAHLHIQPHQLTFAIDSQVDSAWTSPPTSSIVPRPPSLGHKPCTQPPRFTRSSIMFTHLLGHPIRLALSTLKMTCLAHLTLTQLVQASPAQGPSMLPTFTVDGDWIAADMRHRLGRGITTGDLVLYKIPIFANQNGVKRVVGMPGDYVSLGTPGENGEDQMIQVL
ncbi:mitochondrial inner membrane protease subunit 1, putative [Metarhizium acridum CQMa 102]|uniref:Mitochondrial inner membrane protease subunit 1, putative n=1 Tax=Metarhizium acridum (strain CQMa 102) TaxID=655827 RepID=E9EFT6_METAQ|nr:mitochondrial inner membrane protease subunit 1, putative [Metarhizium acridum CQMa 102]EFY85223.1 mitochondrial inner membrane protease subunit 1, putative [Metarhizium acridum CQMa 102]